MKLSNRVSELYFKKYDDQMDGLDQGEQFELDQINVAMDKLMSPNDYSNTITINCSCNETFTSVMIAISHADKFGHTLK